MQVFDAHSDILCDVAVRREAGERQVLRRRHLDRLRRGGVEGSLFVLWNDPPTEEKMRRTMDHVRDELAEAEEFRLVRTVAEAEQAKAEGKIYLFLGLEGMAAMGEDLDWIDRWYDFGCRSAMLTWNEQNALAAGANSGAETGLTALGREAVRRMTEKGMLPDVSHLNDAGFFDLADCAAAPFIASHSNCRALCDSPRNLTDEQLRVIRDAGGVVGLNSFGPFVSRDPARRTVEELALHACHILDVCGVDHLGLGFDFFEFMDDPATNSLIEGDTVAVKGMETAAEIPALLRCLRGHGLSEKELQKVAFGNFRRVLAQTLR